MRPVFASAFAVLALGSLLGASTVPPEKPFGITLVLQFEDDHSNLSIEEMKREVASIMKDSGLQFQFKSLSEIGSEESFHDLIVVKFHGRCSMETSPVLFDERGPLAFTHSSDGEVLPFSEVACDRIKVSIRSAMFGGDHRHEDLLLGRALGRVLAHELYHIVAKTARHGSKGVAQTALSGSQLISDRLDLRPEDVEKLAHR